MQYDRITLKHLIVQYTTCTGVSTQLTTQLVMTIQTMHSTTSIWFPRQNKHFSRQIDISNSLQAV